MDALDVAAVRRRNVAAGSTCVGGDGTDATRARGPSGGSWTSHLDAMYPGTYEACWVCAGKTNAGAVPDGRRRRRLPLRERGHAAADPRCVVLRGTNTTESLHHYLRAVNIGLVGSGLGYILYNRACFRFSCNSLVERELRVDRTRGRVHSLGTVAAAYQRKCIDAQAQEAPSIAVGHSAVLVPNDIPSMRREVSHLRGHDARESRLREGHRRGCGPLPNALPAAASSSLSHLTLLKDLNATSAA